MMKKKLVMFALLFLFMFLFMMPFILAVDTEINIMTEPNYNVSIIVNDMNDLLIKDFNVAADASGSAKATLSSSALRVKLIVVVRNKGKIVEINGDKTHRFDGKTTGGVISIDLKEKPIEPEPVVNETDALNVELNIIPETEPVVEEPIAEPVVEESAGEVAQEQQSGKITGAIVGVGKAIVFSKRTYFIIIGMFILFFAVLIIKKKLHSKRNTYVNFKIKDKRDELEDKTEQIDDKIEEHDEKLLAVENKIKEAKQELDQIRDRKRKLQEARERFERNKAELERLEREE